MAVSMEIHQKSNKGWDNGSSERAFMSFSGKWMELEIIMLNKIRQAQKTPNIASFYSYAESRPEVIIIAIIIGHEHKRGPVLGGGGKGARKEKVLRGAHD
jgi:hypothetical protein